MPNGIFPLPGVGPGTAAESIGDSVVTPGTVQSNTGANASNGVGTIGQATHPEPDPTVEIVEELPGMPTPEEELSVFTDEELLFELQRRKRDPIARGSIHLRSAFIGAGFVLFGSWLANRRRRRR